MRRRLELIDFFKIVEIQPSSCAKYLIIKTIILLYDTQAIFIDILKFFTSKRIRTWKTSQRAQPYFRIRGGNCYIHSGECYFLNCNNHVFKCDFTRENFDSNQSYKRKTDARIRCRILKFCERYKKRF